MPPPVLNSRALKVTIVLDPAEVAQIVAPDGRPRVVLAIRLPDRRVTADLNAKSVRKVLATAEIVAQPKVRPQAAAEAA